MSVTPLGTPSAQELLSEQVQRLLVQPLQDASVVLSNGPRIFDSASPVRIPKAPTPIDADLAFVGENQQIPEASMSFGEVTLLPSTMESIKVIVRFSSELVRQSVVAIDAAIQNRLVTDVASKIDKAFLSATGDGITTPRGLFAQPGIQTYNVGGGITLDQLLDVWGLALSTNVNMSSLRWLVAPNDFVALRKIKDAQDRYQLQPDPTADGVFRLFGSPVVVTSRIPAGKAALLDFSQVAVARDLAPSVTILRERYADFDQVAIRVVARYDIGLLNPAAFISLDNIGTPSGSGTGD